MFIKGERWVVPSVLRHPAHEEAQRYAVSDGSLRKSKVSLVKEGFYNLTTAAVCITSLRLIEKQGEGCDIYLQLEEFHPLKHVSSVQQEVSLKPPNNLH